MVVVKGHVGSLPNLFKGIFLNEKISSNVAVWIDGNRVREVEIVVVLPDLCAKVTTKGFLATLFGTSVSSFHLRSGSNDLAGYCKTN